MTASHKWPQIPLAEICDLQIGRTPSRAQPTYWGPGSPWLSIADMNQGRHLVTTKESITDVAVEACKCRLVPAGTLVMSFKLSVGRVGITGRPMYTNEAIASLQFRQPEATDAGYLYHALGALDFRGIGEQAVKGITLNLKSLSALKIPFPPLAEQRRIAAVLDKADAIRRKRRESLKLLDEFLRSAFLEMFGDPVRNEKGWEVVKLGELADFVGGGTPSRRSPANFAGPICWATSKDFISEEMLDTQEHLSPEAIEASATKLVPQGTILVVVKSKILMHRLPIAIAVVPLCFSQDVKGIFIRENGVPAAYLARHMRLGQQTLLDRARGANTEGLTLEHLRGYKVMIPPGPLLAKWECVEAQYRSLRATTGHCLVASGSLFDALAQRAFGGSTVR